jgi:hypothetical protein
LRKPPTGADTAAAGQFVARVAELAADVATIVAGERLMNERLFELYGLSDGEKLLVEN